MGVKQDYTGCEGGGQKSTNPGMSGDYKPEEFPVQQVPNTVDGTSLTVKITSSPVEVNVEPSEESMIGVDENPLGTTPHVQTTKFSGGGVPGPKSPRKSTL